MCMLEDYRYQYDTIHFNPPSDVISTAKRALEIIAKYRKVKEDGSNEGTGLQKAKTLAAGEAVDHAQLKRMKAYFDKNMEKVKIARTAGENIYNSDIIQKWELWGGDAGMRWVNDKIKSVQDTNVTSKKLRPKGHASILDPFNTRNRDGSSLMTWKG